MPTPPLTDEQLMYTVEVFLANNRVLSSTARALRIGHSTVRSRLFTAIKRQLLSFDHIFNNPLEAKPEVVAPPTQGKSLNEFRKTYDPTVRIPEQIKEALALLGESWLYELEFCRMAGVPVHAISHMRELFAPHVVYLRKGNKYVWAGTPEFAATLRGMVR